MRQWRGYNHTVLVKEDGFEYQGERYRSLSVIAERITGRIGRALGWGDPVHTRLRGWRMTRRALNGTRRIGTVRCAIYTRKSSEEGLEQEFNSLQAQHEACDAFIASQRHEGWVCPPAGYDDGGFSGATLDRPALQQLLS